MSHPGAEAEHWDLAWKPLIECVGQDFSDGNVRWGADAVEPGGVRRFLEPLELDCPIYYDRSAALAHGYQDIVAPCASVMTWSLPAQWVPGQILFDNASRNAPPAYSPLTGVRPSLAPSTTGFFATEFEADFLVDVLVGDRLGRRGQKLLRCAPKETGVGRGAFLTWETEIVNQRLDVVARTRMTFYYFNPVHA